MERGPTVHIHEGAQKTSHTQLVVKTIVCSNGRLNLQGQ